MEREWILDRGEEGRSCEEWREGKCAQMYCIIEESIFNYKEKEKRSVSKGQLYSHVTALGLPQQLQKSGSTVRPPLCWAMEKVVPPGMSSNPT